MQPQHTTSEAGSASWKQESAPKKETASKSSKPSSPAVPQLPVYQAKLNWVTMHSPAWGMAKVKALNAFSTLTGKELQERYAALNRDYLALEKALAEWPDDDMQGARWLELKERLTSWRGQLAGLWDLMKRPPKKPLNESSASSGTTTNGDGDTSSPQWKTISD